MGFMKLRARWAGVAAIALAGAGLAVINATDASAAVTSNLSGTVTCSAGQAVQGVWVESNAGCSQWAGWTALPGRAADALYWANPTYNAAGSWLKLHVGCGGTRANWRSTIITPWVYMRPGTFTVNTICDASRAGRWDNACSFPTNGQRTTFNQGYAGYCTWGAYNKWYQNLGYYPNIGGNANQMDDNAARKGWRVVDTPSRRSMIVFNSGGGGYGHVAWVDNVRWDGALRIDITEMNYGTIIPRTDAKTNNFNRYTTRTLTWDPSKVGDWKFIQAYN